MFPRCIWLQVLLLLLKLYLNSGHRIRNCDTGFKCIALKRCPRISKFTHGSYRDSMKVRQAICGFHYTVTLVCCPNERKFSIVEGPEELKRLLPNKCGRSVIHNRIFGGNPTPIGAYPWVAALAYSVPGREEFMVDCSGSIISERYILTAAHCLDKKLLGRRRFTVVYLGVWNLKKDKDCNKKTYIPRCYRHMTAGYEKIVMHPQYDKVADSSYDIALIRLNITLDFTSKDNVLIEPVCLPPRGLNIERFVDDRMTIVAGWGLTEFGEYSSVLMSVELPLVSNNICLRRYGSQFVGKQLCVGGEKGKDSCIGDSGGPLVITDPTGPPFIQIGIVSFGRRPCGGKASPSVYTSVVEFKSWIVSNLRP